MIFSSLIDKNRVVKLAPILLIVVLGVCAYYNSLFNAFVWDDELLIINNQLIKSYKYITDIFKASGPLGGGGSGIFYRPLVSLSYMLDYSSWRLYPLGYHLTNILLHITNSLFVFFLIKRISKTKDTALLVAVLFLLSPLLSEVVNFISARADLLMGMLFLLSALFFIDYRNTNLKIYYFGSIFFFAASVLSKEVALITPFVFILYDWTFGDSTRHRPKAAYIKDYSLYFLVILLYIALRILLWRLEFLNFIAENEIAEVSLFHRMLTAAKVIFLYFRLLIFPYDLHVERAIVVAKTAFKLDVFLSLLGLVALGALLIYLYKKNRLGFFGLAWFFLTLLPYSNIYPLNAFMGEGWVYIPAIGFWLLLSLGFEKLINISSQTVKKLLYIGLVLFLSLQIYFTVSRSLDWRTPLTLYSKDIKKAPYSAILHTDLGVEYFRRGNFERAEREFLKATRLYSELSIAHHNLGSIYEHRHLFDAAIAKYKDSIAINDYYLAHLSLGTLYTRLGKLDLAIEALEDAAETVPYSAEAHYNLGFAYYKNGDNKKAAQEFSRAMELDKKYIFMNEWIEYYR